MLQSIKRYISGSLRTRLLAILLLFSMAGLALLGVVLFWRSSNILIAQEREHTRLELNQLASNLESFIGQTDVISKDFDAAEIVQTVLSQSAARGSADVDEQREVDHFIGKTVVTHSQWLAALNMFDAKGVNYYEGPPGTSITADEYQALRSTSFYERMVRAKGRMVVGPLDPEGRYVLIGRIINSTSEFRPFGVMIMHVKVEAITNYFDKSGLGASTEYVLYNPYGDAIGSGNHEMGGRPLVSVSDGEEVTLGETRYLVSREDIPVADWKLLKLTTIQSIIGSTEVLKQTLWIFGMICAVVIIFLSILISRWISRPLINLTNLMKRSIEERFLIKAPAQREDEVGQLSRSYNLMMKEINDLINKEYKLNYLNKEMELQSLQAQINPHFIYNTLDTINWAARLHGMDDIGKMAESLANLLRISIRDQDKPYHIREEIEYISNYMSIQQYRFEDRIRMELDVAPEVYDVPIPRLIIQPLLENAIVHNVDRNERPTTIVIRMTADDAERAVMISVTDNGTGIPDHVIAGIHRTEKEESAFPRGLANVHRRLVLEYGESAGLNIHSSDEGTTIQFKIPSKKEVEHHDL
jgi:two-component system, sensor histidine kinase YesM